jgi:hypothetical protein
MHPQMLEEPGGAIDYIPARPIHIEMGLYCQLPLVNETYGGIKFKLG